MSLLVTVPPTATEILPSSVHDSADAMDTTTGSNPGPVVHSGTDSASLTDNTSTAQKTSMANSASVTGSASSSIDVVSTSVPPPHSTQLYSSFPNTAMESSSLLPVQHATEKLPSNQTTAVASDTVSGTSDSVENTQNIPSLTKANITTSAINTETTNSAVTGNADSITVNMQQNITTSVLPSVTSASNIGSIVDQMDFTSNQTLLYVSDTEMVDKNSESVLNSFTTKKSDTIKVTTTSSIVHNVPTTHMPNKISPSSTWSQFEPSSSDLFSPYTTTQTSFSSAHIAVDSAPQRTTSAAPLPSVTSKPVNPSPKGNSTILGGGLSDYIIYIGVPAAGLLLLLLLIICIICIRRRKQKEMGGSVGSRNHDLWLNNKTDIPLNISAPLPEVNGGCVLPANKEDTGCSLYKAVREFQGSHVNHLSLQPGDVIHVERKEEAGWWRGKKGSNSGWFPSNYVQPAPDDEVHTENEIEMHEDSGPVSSFMLKRGNSPDTRCSSITEEQISQEPIYCKIQPKDKRRSGSKASSERSASVSPAKLETSCTDYLSPIHDGNSTDYIALYPYEAQNSGELTIYKGDIIQCKEGERHGWIKGTNHNTQKKGWCPFSYVQKVEREVEAAPHPSSYQHLEANKVATGGDEKGDHLVGIVHKAVHTFTAEKAGDLEFEAGDLITVFQVLENGWWLGSKDKTVGWFPGTFVQMLEHASTSSGRPSPLPDANITFEDNKPASQTPTTNENTSLTTVKPTSRPTANEERALTPNNHKHPTKLSPARKAPPPPIQVPKLAESRENLSHSPQEVKDTKLPSAACVGIKTPKQIRPKVPPPAPPVRSADTELSHSRDLYEQINDDLNPLYETIGHKLESDHSEAKPSYDSITGTEESEGLQNKDTTKPKRYINPRLVTVPRAEVELPEWNKSLVNGDLMRLRSPPPPRPGAPKLGPIRAKLTAPVPLEDQVPNTEGDLSFNVLSQRKFGSFVRQDSNDTGATTPESPPYKALSSFGSTFGKKQESPQVKPVSSQPAVLDITEQEVSNAKCVINKQPSPVYSELKAMETPKSESIDLLGEIMGSLGDHETSLSKPIDNLSKHVEEKDSRDSETDLPKPIKSLPNPVEMNSEHETHIPKSIDNPLKHVNNDFVEELPKEKAKARTGIPMTPKMKGSKLSSQKNGTSAETCNQRPQELESPLPVKSGPENVNRLETEPAVITPVDITDKASKSPKIPSDAFSRTPNVQTPTKTPPKSTPDDNVLHNQSAQHLEESKHQTSQVTGESDASSNSDNSPSTESSGHQPVTPKLKSNLPKVLPKPKAIKKPQDFHTGISNEDNMSDNKAKDVRDDKESLKSSMQKDRNTSESESDSKSPGEPKVSTRTAREHKSGIPALGGRKQSKERSKSRDNIQDSDTDSTLSPTLSPRSKLASPLLARAKKSPQSDKKSLRNRSNSPANRSAIPTKKNTSNSSLPTSVPTSPIPSNKQNSKQKRSGLVPPKKLSLSQSGQTINQSGTGTPNNKVSQSPSDDGELSSDKDNSFETSKSDRPPQSEKVMNHDGKPRKQSKSLLPVVHKNIESDLGSPNGVSGNKPKRGIPVVKPARPPPPKSPTEGNPRPPQKSPTEKNPSPEQLKKTLYRAVKGYTAQCDGELTFSEGTFIKELSDCDRPGWYVGMLADGTTGIYPADHLKPSPVTA